ncbi:galactose oxidase [Punctularia strigosozonata HHB-11173 SS5]|uniref:galactose oxidase n=1 Tax=Punctularia strigosozonata (strain HHB-11173) TaxID=741275 RepID=UPI0004418278|nr:galactose oxidase [Punctularia strigosozonata HHB-11173 SS5]EIN11125.1 galactose oxidase [Punctularia strigosozonata HHB-11173 SS5]
MRRDWEAAHTVSEELVEGPPSRRVNATLTPCPIGPHLWCIGGEFFSEDGKAHFYKDVFRYTPEKDEWRKFVSPTCPDPRSAHAVAASPAGGGKLYLFGGEYSSLYQNTFHHYRDFWCFDISSHVWDRIDTKVRPSARSGHRMAMWKQYIFLFGGFYDPGITTRYLDDLWVFDTQYYRWHHVEFKENDRRPSPRSGFSFLPAADGILLHGGYCKEYAKGKRPIGVMLDDTWFLRITASSTDDSASSTPSTSPRPSKKANDALPLLLKWERRKRPSTAYAPSLRSGCTMALWPAKGMGVLFGGVTDEDTSEETLESTFHNDLYGYQIAGNGRWVSMTLKKPKEKGKGAKKKQSKRMHEQADREDVSDREGGSDEDITRTDTKIAIKLPESRPEPQGVSDDPTSTIPLPRYNAMLAVLRNNLYIYGGIFESRRREYTLDDFYTIALDKMDRYICLKESGIHIPKEEEEESSSEEGDDESDDDSEVSPDGEHRESSDTEDEREMESVREDEQEFATGIVLASAHETEDTVVDNEDTLRARATVFMGVSRDTTRSAEDAISTPLPGETLAMFYARSRDYWAGKAYGSSDNRGKLLRRDGFTLAEERYSEYKPLLAEIERILADAGLDEEEIKQSAASGPTGAMGQSRNRR